MINSCKRITLLRRYNPAVVTRHNFVLSVLLNHSFYPLMTIVESITGKELI